MTSARNHDQFTRIANFVLTPDFEVPEPALRHASTLLIDTLGVAAGAKMLEVAQIARNFAAEFHGAGSEHNAARMLFDGRKASIPGAAWALGTQIDNLDGHDGYNPTKGHIGCAIVPALFAFAEHRPDLTGREALLTMVMAYEVAARAGISLHATVSDYHTSGAWNALGVAAIGCRLGASTPEQLRHALGIAEYHGPRSQMMREIDNPTMLHDGSGMGALVGAKAALLAQRGFTGAPALTIESSQVADFWSDLGQRWTVAENYIKPYPSCRWGHAAIDALGKLMQDERVSAETVAEVQVRTFDEGARLFSGMPETTTQAQYSMNFALAIMLAHGNIGPKHISGEGLKDDLVATLVPKIKVQPDAQHNADFPTYRRSDVTVILNNGKRISSGTVDARGGPDAWLEDEEVEKKLHTFCEGILPETQISKLWKMRDRLLDKDMLFSELAEMVCEQEKIN